MREIKFRVFFYDGGSDYSTGEMFTGDAAAGEDFIEWSKGGELKPTDECSILMQYTGLFDKNGKEIYEGDILSGKNHPYQVIFCYGSFDINWPPCCNHCAKGDASHGSLYEYLACEEGMEVIGNLYENPELMKSKV